MAAKAAPADKVEGDGEVVDDTADDSKKSKSKRKSADEVKAAWADKE